VSCRVCVLCSWSRSQDTGDQQDLEHEHNTPNQQDTGDQQDLDHEHNTQTRQDTGDQNI
jgi:hypothetical protein